MSSLAAQPGPSATDRGATGRPMRSMAAQILGKTFVRWGARIGVAWIAVLVLLAVFGPVIANSYPLGVKIDGRWASPAAARFTPVDVMLFVGFFAAVALTALRPIMRRHRAKVWLAIMLVTIPLAMWLVHPPTNAVYEQYREEAAVGRLEAVVWAPIPYSPSDRLRDVPVDQRESAPWWTLNEQSPQRARMHWLGTDTYHQDVAGRMIHAARVALTIGFIATGIAAVIGIIVGGIMGYFAGAVDLVGMRVIEIFEFIPQLFLLLMFVAFFERNIYLIMIIIGLTSWPGNARYIRAEFLRIRKQDYVQAAIATGLPLRSVLFRHMLPNGITPVLVSASFGVASAIIAEATLSFLGLGLPPEDPSWGELLNQATTGTGTFTWWIATFPGLAIFITVFAYVLIGEALRDAIDPHTQRAMQM